jgi:periplasmic protein TonB
MFEQSTLSNGASGVRAWTTFLGMTSQIVLVTLAVLAPMVFPQVLPTARFLETLAPPLPPAPEPKPLDSQVRQGPTIREVWDSRFIAPTHIPKGPIPTIEDEPTGPPIVGIPIGMGGPNGGVVGGILRSLSNTVPVIPPPIPAPVVKPATPEAPPVIQRFREGGRVSLGALLHKVEPQYPALAKTAHVSGTVELECVVGVDGHIQEVKVKSGNPLLIQAAVQAAWQWVYSPTKLNGTPIEIITNLTFSFKLN